ncbi:hypothetical protein [Mycobacterium sp. M23085]|uniref:hypothetical protein n=1 Tax=Mycobacterium sp. M23085 TaxID=3378087 RepID=UPI003877B853
MLVSINPRYDSPNCHQSSLPIISSDWIGAYSQTMAAQPPTHLSDVPESDQEMVSREQITEGDYLFDLPTDQWVTIDRVTGEGTGLGSWKIEQHEPGKWTFHRYTETIVNDPGANAVMGNVIRRKRS